MLQRRVSLLGNNNTASLPSLTSRPKWHVHRRLRPTPDQVHVPSFQFQQPRSTVRD
jgi:hypothetical protein